MNKTNDFIGDYTSGKEKFNKADYQGAIEDFSQVIEKDPEYAFYYQSRAEARKELKDYSGISNSP